MTPTSTLSLALTDTQQSKLETKTSGADRPSGWSVSPGIYTGYELSPVAEDLLSKGPWTGHLVE